MKLNKLFFMTLISTNFVSTLWAGMPIDYNCKVKQGTYDAVKIKKENKNVLHIALRLDQKTCTVKSGEPMVMYWSLGERTQRGVTPCQAVSSYEYRLMGLRPSNATKLNSHQVSIYYPKIAEIAQDFNHKADESFEIESYSTAQGCMLDTTFRINEQDVLFDELQLKMSIFSLKGIDLLLKGHLVYRL